MLKEYVLTIKIAQYIKKRNIKWTFAMKPHLPKLYENIKIYKPNKRIRSIYC